MKSGIPCPFAPWYPTLHRGIMNKMREGLFGVNPILEALRSGTRGFDKVYIARGTYSKGVEEIVRLCKEQNIPVHFENRETLDRISGTTKHQGLFGMVTAKGYSPVEEILGVAEKKGEQPFILILDGVEDPRNLGAIIRTADGAGAHGIVIPKHRASGLSGTAAKTSAGAIEYVTVSRVTNLRHTIDSLKEKGVWIYGLDMEGEKEYTDAAYDVPLAVVIGGEGRGIRETILKACDVRIRIPLLGHISSLNVSVATGVILFEIARQRSKRINPSDKC